VCVHVYVYVHVCVSPSVPPFSRQPFNRLIRTWRVYCWGPKEVQCRVCSCLGGRHLRKPQGMVPFWTGTGPGNHTGGCISESRLRCEVVWLSGSSERAASGNTGDHTVGRLRTGRRPVAQIPWGWGGGVIMRAALGDCNCDLRAIQTRWTELSVWVVRSDIEGMKYRDTNCFFFCQAAALRRKSWWMDRATSSWSEMKAALLNYKYGLISFFLKC